MNKNSNYKTAHYFSVIIVILMGFASLGGLLIKGLYRDNFLVTSGWYGNDLITLFISVPLLVLSLILSKRGSLHGQLVWLGMLYYTLYNYAFYLFGAAYNGMFLVYVALFTLSFFAFFFGILSLDMKEISLRFRPEVPVRFISVYMLLVATMLGCFHIIISLDFIFTGKVPEIVNNVGHPTSLISALDLSMVVSVGVLAAIWLWRRKTFGYVLAVIWNVKGAVYMTALTASSVTAYQAGAAEDVMQISLWGPIAVGCLIALLFMLRKLESSDYISNRVIK